MFWWKTVFARTSFCTVSCTFGSCARSAVYGPVAVLFWHGHPSAAQHSSSFKPQVLLQNKGFHPAPVSCNVQEFLIFVIVVEPPAPEKRCFLRSFLSILFWKEGESGYMGEEREKEYRNSPGLGDSCAAGGSW